MSTNRYLADLAGTLKTTFRIATSMWKDVSTVMTARDKADANNIPVAMSRLDLRGTGNSHRASITVASNPSADITWNWPIADGGLNQVLATDGSGNLSFITVGTGASQVKEDEEAVAWNSAAIIASITPPANARTLKIIVAVDTAFDGTSPQLSVGVTGTTSKYMAVTDNDLTTAAIYEVAPDIAEGGSPGLINIYFTAGGGGTTGAARVAVQYVNPS
jgi:hypothetical protein